MSYPQHLRAQNSHIPDIPHLKHRGGSRAAATPKMEHFVIIVDGWKRFKKPSYGL